MPRSRCSSTKYLLVRQVAPLILFSGALSLCFGSVGCSTGEVQHPSWDSLSEEQIEAALQNPTGALASMTSGDIGGQLSQTMPVALEVAHFLGHLTVSMQSAVQTDFGSEGLTDAGQSPPPPATEDTAFASSFYVRAACPGKNILPPFDFENGQVWVESPELGSIDKAALLSGGEFLLRFDDCQLPIGVLDTQFPGRYVSNNVPYLQVPGAPSDPQDGPEFALALTTGKVDQAAIGILGVACGSATTSCREDVRVALELQAPNGGSYVVTFRATSHFWSGTVQELEVSIGGADGTLSCTYSAKERTVNCGG